MNNGLKDDFAKFCTEPSRETLRDFFRTHLGETDQADFKAEWPAPAKLARHILAMANTGGGCLFVGFAEEADKTIRAVGLKELRGKEKVEQEIARYLPHFLRRQVLDFVYSGSEYAMLEGKKFQVLIIEDLPEYLPFVAAHEGESEGEKIRKGAIYIRRGTSSLEAAYEDIQVLINRRLATSYSNQGEFGLQQELGELRVLYHQIPSTIQTFPGNDYSEYEDPMIDGYWDPNPMYPSEDYDQFINKLIEAKKKRVAMICRVNLEEPRTKPISEASALSEPTVSQSLSSN